MQKDTAPSNDPSIPEERNIETKLRLDGEADTLYDDGLKIDTDAGELAGTRGKTPGIAKP